MAEEKVLEQVQALLARAEHPNTPEPERELCFSRANKLMAKHALDEALIRSRQSAQERRKPVSERFKWMEHYSEFSVYLRTIVSEICAANRCRAVIHPQSYEITVVGFKDDVSWVHMLYMNCYLAFLSTLYPKWDETLGYDHNVYNFKRAGYKWSEINATAVAHGGPDFAEYVESNFYNEKRPTGRIKGGVIAAYKRHAKKVGDEDQIKTQRHDAYRTSFAEAFAHRIAARLERMRREAEEVADSAPGAMLALRNSVDEAFFAEFPQFHPDEVARRNQAAAEEARRIREREERERQEMLDAMTPKQRAAFLEKEERARRRDARRNARYWEDYDRRNAGDSYGRQAGRAAADTVSLNRSEGVDKSSRKEIG